MRLDVCTVYREHALTTTDKAPRAWGIDASSDTHHHPHWHGFTAMADCEMPIVTSAKGCHLTTTDGRDLIDGVSSLWCNLHGHNHPELNDAVEQQIRRVAHVPTLGIECDTTLALARRIIEIAPMSGGHVFFSSDGSSAVEAAIKMAFQHHRQKSAPEPHRNQFLAMGGAYHGDTTGSVSLGGIDRFHKLFAEILFRPVRGPTPCSYRIDRPGIDRPNIDRPGIDQPGIDRHDAAAVRDHYVQNYEALFRRHGDTLAAVVIEPTVQGAAGMISHPPGFLAAIRRMCDQHGVLMIADEVATGFTRTGRMFACEHESVSPDILCMGKGLSGGYLPIAATMATPEIFESFLGRATQSRQFFHGHTFGGNPVAAAVALRSIDLILRNDLPAVAERRAGELREHLRPLDDHPHVGDIRGRGLMFGIELVADRTNKRRFAPEHEIGRRVCAAAMRRNVWIRPLGDVIVIMPPPVIEPETMAELATAVVESIVEVCHAISGIDP